MIRPRSELAAHRPEGVRQGAAVAGDWLVVAVESRYGKYEAWGFDGQGWWLLLQRDATRRSGPVRWPAPHRDVPAFSTDR